MTHSELQTWLAEKPLNTPCEICGERVALQVNGRDAELVGYLSSNPDGFTLAQLKPILEHGFFNALDFGAGLGLSGDGRHLTLTQWLPGVASWVAAATALEGLLNQLETCRAALPGLKPSASDAFAPTATTTKTVDRTQQRLRAMLAERK